MVERLLAQRLEPFERAQRVPATEDPSSMLSSASRMASCDRLRRPQAAHLPAEATTGDATEASPVVAVSRLATVRSMASPSAPGTTPHTLGYHFGSKEGLPVEVVRAVKHGQRARALSELFAGDELSPIEQMCCPAGRTDLALARRSARLR